MFQEPLDGVTIAEGVAQDVARLLGDRLLRVVLYGSWARGDARVDSDVDILVVATEVGEKDNSISGPLSELEGDWFERSGRPVSIRVVSEDDIAAAVAARYPTAREMFLRTANSEGRIIAHVAA